MSGVQSPNLPQDVRRDGKTLERRRICPAGARVEIQGLKVAAEGIVPLRLFGALTDAHADEIFPDAGRGGFGRSQIFLRRLRAFHRFFRPDLPGRQGRDAQQNTRQRPRNTAGQPAIRAPVLA